MRKDTNGEASILFQFVAIRTWNPQYSEHMQNCECRKTPMNKTLIIFC